MGGLFYLQHTRCDDKFCRSKHLIGNPTGRSKDYAGNVALSTSGKTTKQLTWPAGKELVTSSKVPRDLQQLETVTQTELGLQLHLIFSSA